MSGRSSGRAATARARQLGSSDTDAELRRLLPSLTNPERIVAVALGGLERYAEVVREDSPHVEIVYDRMHVQKDVLVIAVVAWFTWHRANAHHRDAASRAARVGQDQLLH